MFNNSKFKKVLVSTLVFVLLLSTVVVAANNIYEKQLTATHGRIKFKVDGKDVTEQIETKYGSPIFTVREYGDRSYVPLRSIAELMGMEVKYDDATHTAEIIDTKAKEYDDQLKKKDAEITKLEKEITKLEKELATYKKDVVEETDLKSLEKDIVKKFGNYDNMDFNISLKESKNNITVSIDVDFYDTRQQSYWNRMTHAEKKAMIEDMTDMISKEFKNANITGSIYDTYYRSDLLTFSKKSNSSSVSISYRDYRYDDYYYRYDDYYYYDYILDDAEYYIENYFSRFSDVGTISINDRSSGDIYGKVYIYEDRYINLRDSDIENAFRDTEDVLMNRYGSAGYLDIDLYLNGDYYGTYSNGKFSH